MRLFTAIGMALAMSTSALAGPEEPVTGIMDLATAMWSEKAPEGADYFDKDHIGLFSKDFRAAYDEAKKFSYLEGGGVFDYDVITSSQEGCPLEDVSISPGAAHGETTVVKVTFKLMACYETDPDKDALSELHFKVVTEDGKSAIADIDRIIDGKPMSLVSEMKDMAKEGASAPETQQEPQQ